MSQVVERPDPDAIMAGLKDFQQKTVEYVFKRLFLDEKPGKRFLIADEVGLGKTLVAKGLIAKAVNYLWDRVKRLDIIYICSNAEIARQNINRLKINKEIDFALSTRITLLPVSLHDLEKNKLNFISFTPGTSFDLRSQEGIKRERALLYHILSDEWDLGRRKKHMAVFQGWAGNDTWISYLRGFLERNKINQDLKKGFIDKLNIQIKEARKNGEKDIKTCFEDLSERFDPRREPTNQDYYDRKKFIGELRNILATSCITALEPDLIILDEFQRFKHLLDGQDQMSQLAKVLFDYTDARTLLLSATPYKMYTMHHEDEDNHYEDFIRTARFLLDSEDKTGQLKDRLKEYRNDLYRITDYDPARYKKAKDGVEKILKSIMTRTERLGVTNNNDGMICEKDGDIQLSRSELASFVNLDRISHELGAGDCLEYWKSSPYLLNFMDNYMLKRKFKERIDNGTGPLAEIIKDAKASLLPWKTINSFKKIDPASSKLQALMDNTVTGGGWKLLWIPPSLPYYQYSGVYAESGVKDLTKNLVFSSWQVVPKVISTICSYEAERRMVELFDDNTKYSKERKRRRPLLMFSIQEGRHTGMPVFTSLYPCATLAVKVDPLSVAKELCVNGELPSYDRMLSEISNRVRRLLEEADSQLSLSKTGQVDERWYWAALAILDRYFYSGLVQEWLEPGNPEIDWRELIKGKRNSDADSGFTEHVNLFQKYFNNPETLGEMPADLFEVLAETVLASPAVTALRSIYRRWPEITPVAMFAAAKIAAGFRSMYNLPETITLIRGLKGREPYWKRILEYGAEGNLQAVMDEYLHVLYESEGLSGHHADKGISSIADIVAGTVSLRTVNLDYDSIRVSKSDIYTKKHSLRCRYALRFGEGRNDEDGEVTRQDQVRTAFNSPFRPFILATTSIGQEGLDFHQYCHSIYHWNLPSNPVDLEQREGRIHRYKGHVIRKNVAKKYGLHVISKGIENCEDPWDKLFNLALKNREEGVNDLIPYWIFEIEDGFKVERNVPSFPLSRDKDHLSDLKRTIAAYRMVFGQARQEDLLNYLKTNTDKRKLEDILKYRIDLSPGNEI